LNSKISTRYNVKDNIENIDVRICLLLGEVKSSERFPLANKAKKRSELFTSPNICEFCKY